MRKTLTYEELISLAKENYAKGGDAVAECWDRATFDEYEKLFGPMTERRALEMFETLKARYDEYRAMAEW